MNHCNVNNQSGFTLISVIVSMALMSTILLTVTNMVDKSEKIFDLIRDNSDVLDLYYYVNKNFSCGTTLNSSTCGSSFEDIDTYSPSNEILTRKDGSDIGDYEVKAQCQKDEFIFMYKNSSDHWLPISKVPVICTESAPAITTNFYYSPIWGYMLLVIDDDNSVLATYEFLDGAITGSYDPSTGEVTGYWCEQNPGCYTWNGVSKCDGGIGNLMDRGDGWAEKGGAHFKFEVSMEDGLVNQYGSWDYSYSGSPLYEDWALENVVDPDPTEKAIFNDLKARFISRADFCYP